MSGIAIKRTLLRFGSSVTLSSTVRAGIKVSWRDIQAKSVQIWKNKIDEWNLPQIGELYVWNRPYDPNFLGYLAGTDDKY